MKAQLFLQKVCQVLTEIVLLNFVIFLYIFPTYKDHNATQDDTLEVIINK